MYKLGLKIWSHNVNYAEEIKRLWENKCFDYVEVFVKPGTYDEFSDFWKNTGLPFVIHAAHFAQGVNLSAEGNYLQNEKLIGEAKRFADKVKSDKIIVHPGVGGTIGETIRQLSVLSDKRFVVENKPYYGFTKEQICIGYAPEQIKEIVERTGLSFCLDFGHAIYAANAVKQDPIGYLRRFLKLRPIVFHLTDGDWQGLHDKHLRYGRGNFNLSNLLCLVPNDAMITNEAEKAGTDSLATFEEDAIYLQKIDEKLYDNQSIVSIRPASMVDATDIYKLSVDPIVRQLSLNSSGFSFESHVVWLQNAIIDPKLKFYICQINGEFGGQLRCAIDGVNATISISVADAWRQTGIAPKLFQWSLKQLIRTCPAVQKIIAVVKDVNEISKKYFTGLGFKRDSTLIQDNMDSNVVFSLDVKQYVR